MLADFILVYVMIVILKLWSSTCCVGKVPWQWKRCDPHIIFFKEVGHFLVLFCFLKTFHILFDLYMLQKNLRLLSIFNVLAKYKSNSLFLYSTKVNKVELKTVHKTNYYLKRVLSILHSLGTFCKYRVGPIFGNQTRLHSLWQSLDRLLETFLRYSSLCDSVMLLLQICQAHS